MMFAVVLFLLIQHIYASTYTVQLNDVDLNCVKESTKSSSFPIQTLSFNIWSNQLSIPGIMYLSLSFNLTKKFSDDIQVSTKFERKLGSTWTDLPCTIGLVACDKQSLCNLIQQKCKTNNLIRSNSQDNKKSCNCDLNIGSHTIEHFTVNIKDKKRTKLVKPITTGQYRFKVKFIEPKTKTTIGCVIGYLTLLKANKFT